LDYDLTTDRMKRPRVSAIETSMVSHPIMIQIPFTAPCCATTTLPLEGDNILRGHVKCRNGNIDGRNKESFPVEVVRGDGSQDGSDMILSNKTVKRCMALINSLHFQSTHSTTYIGITLLKLRSLASEPCQRQNFIWAPGNR
jgi:hypothetical protein